MGASRKCGYACVYGSVCRVRVRVGERVAHAALHRRFRAAHGKSMRGARAACRRRGRGGVDTVCGGRAGSSTRATTRTHSCSAWTGGWCRAERVCAVPAGKLGGTGKERSGRHRCLPAHAFAASPRGCGGPRVCFSPSLAWEGTRKQALTSQRWARAGRKGGVTGGVIAVAITVFTPRPRRSSCFCVAAPFAHGIADGIPAVVAAFFKARWQAWRCSPCRHHRRKH